MRTHFRAVRQRRQHFAAFRRAERAQRRFIRTDNPLDRATELLGLAECEDVMAATAAAFPGSDEPDTDGHTLPETHRLSARVLRLVADTELDLAAGLAWIGDHDDQLHTLAEAELTKLAQLRALTARARAVIDLYNAVVDQVGGQAGETLANIASCYCRAAGLATDQSQALLGRPQGTTR